MTLKQDLFRALQAAMAGAVVFALCAALLVGFFHAVPFLAVCLAYGIGGFYWFVEHLAPWAVFGLLCLTVGLPVSCVISWVWNRGRA